MLALQLLQQLLPASGNAHRPALAGQCLGHFEANARGGSHDDSKSLVHSFGSFYLLIFATKVRKRIESSDKNPSFAGFTAEN
jgi:hypothetical protein